MFSFFLPKYLGKIIIHIIYCECLWEVLLTNPDSITSVNLTVLPLMTINKEKTQSREGLWCKWNKI